MHLNRGDSNTRQTLDASAAFNYEAQLFRLETYKDKYGRTICKRTVRFARRRTGRNVGEVTPELAEALSRRPGKGRTAEARAEVERNRLLAESLAERLRRAMTGVVLRLEKAEVDGKPAVILTLLEVSFCPECQTFHGTKEPHTCIR